MAASGKRQTAAVRKLREAGAAFAAFAVVFVVVAGMIVFWRSNREGMNNEEKVGEIALQSGNMELKSAAFVHGGEIPRKYTCDGENINPPLSISGVPAGAESLVLIMDDPDVPRSVRPDGMWDHWLVWDIPPETMEIAEGSEPPGTVGRNTSGETGYQGPCPPDREHRYFFRVYALDAVLGLSPDKTGKDDLFAAMSDHILGQAELMGRYKRN